MKTTLLTQTVVGPFSAPWMEPSTLKKPKILKSTRITEQQERLTNTTFQQRGTSAVQNINSQSPINHTRYRSAGSRNRSIVIQTTPQVIYQPVQSFSNNGLPKLMLTEFSGEPQDWPEWSGWFGFVVHQKLISNTEKNKT